MTTAASLAATAALVGDPARASMLGALLGGRALTATELAVIAGVTPQTASGHLGRLVEGRLKPADPAQMALVQAETVRFWRAYLDADATAMGELCSLPERVRAQADGYVKAARCGAPTPLPR